MATEKLFTPLRSYWDGNNLQGYRSSDIEVSNNDLNGCYVSMFEGCNAPDSVSYPKYPPPPRYYGVVQDATGWVDSTTEAGQDRIREHNISSWKAICHILTHK